MTTLCTCPHIGHYHSLLSHTLYSDKIDIFNPKSVADCRAYQHHGPWTPCWSPQDDSIDAVMFKLKLEFPY